MNEPATQQAITIRHTLKPGDVGYIIYLHGKLYDEEYGLTQEFEGYVASALGQFAQSPDRQKDCIWIAELNGQIVGSIAIVGYSEAVAQLRWFLIHPQTRGQGLGHRLINEALEFCRQQKFKSVILWTLSNLDAARHLYQAAGFVKTEEKTHLIWGHLLTEERYELMLD